VDTIQGVLNYKRAGPDSKIIWSPPSALRRIDLILMDEASQYEDQEWNRFFTSIKEQPHSPFVGVVADFQQLQPVVSGGMCQQFCERMQCVKLQTVYRSRDEEHLLFLNRIRQTQPNRTLLDEYFLGRHWRGRSLEACVAEGIELAEKQKEPFSWLTCTNKGASEVCEAALALLGHSAKELASGYLCDPATKSDLRIVAKRGILLRLSRNFDKQRGFVNGALAVVCESLRGNEVFTARLVGTGNMVLVHPIEEQGSKFLPCCYGYATTIRRAQGADLYQGCIYFDQKKRVAARGYGYVAVSRFKSRAGCYVYGKLRRSDFLPVGPEQENEVLERGYESVSSADSDGCGLEYAFNVDDQDCEYVFNEEDHGSVPVDFL
jgi:ATP-dependent exoDNAse (exonuclease V) alpha subunit